MSCDVPLGMAQGLVAVIEVAREAGVLAALTERVTAAELATRLALEPRALTLLLRALVALGVVEELEGAFVRRADALSPHEPWRELAVFLRDGEVHRGIDDVAQRGESYGRVVAMLGQRFLPLARDLAAQLPEVATVLDVGAGSGVWSLAMAERSPSTRVVLVDLPEVVAVARERAEAMGLAERVEPLAGDYFEVALDRRFDRVVLANVLHLETEPDAASLVGRYARLLSPGGELVIIDCIEGEGYAHEVVVALYTLHLGMRTARGKPHHLHELCAWATAAGLGEHTVLRPAMGSAGFGALVCRAARAAGARQPPQLG